MRLNFNNIIKDLKVDVKKIAKGLIINFVIPSSIVLFLITILMGVIVGSLSAVLDDIDVFGSDTHSSSISSTVSGNTYINNIVINNVYNRISYSSIQLTSEDIEKLYRITYSERGDGNQAQQEYVASVILNRVLYSGFPNTVGEVITAPNQFEAYSNGSFDKATPTDITKAAVDNVIKNGDTSQGAVYFMTPAAAEKQEWLKNCMFLFNDGDNSPNLTHNFYTNDAALTELQQYITNVSNNNNHSSNDPDFYANYNKNIASGKILSLIDFALQQEGKNLSKLKSEYSSIWMQPDDNWCADFVSFCFQANGLVGEEEGKAIPRWQRAANNGYKIWLNEKYGNCYLKGNYIPKPGDVLVYSWSHVGLIYACDGNYVYVIEGNSGTYDYNTSYVSLTKYQLNSNSIYGYYPSSININ